MVKYTRTPKPSVCERIVTHSVVNDRSCFGSSYDVWGIERSRRRRTRGWRQFKNFWQSSSAFQISQGICRSLACVPLLLSWNCRVLFSFHPVNSWWSRMTTKARSGRGSLAVWKWRMWDVNVWEDIRGINMRTHKRDECWSDSQSRLKLWENTESHKIGSVSRLAKKWEGWSLGRGYHLES